MSPARSRLVTGAIFVGFVIATMARGTGPFRWDAAHYWAATQAMVGALPAVPDGYWELRGVLTPFIYAPAAGLTRLIGDQHAGLAVLIQNSLVLAAAAVVLLPAVMRIWRPVSTIMLLVGAVLFWAVTSGFAAYPLVDLYPALGILALLPLARSTRPMLLLVAGLVAGIAVNVRPAYVVVVILVAIIAVIWRRVSGLLLAAGTALAIVPQIAFNLIRSGTWSPLPTGSEGLVALQSGYASYIVRYDTIIGDASGQQFSCSPEMAGLVGDFPPQSSGELALTLLQNLPASLGFSFQKIAASLNWHASIPYAADVRAIDVVYGIAITAVAVIGIVAAFHAATRRSETGTRDGYGVALLGATVGGAVITLVSSATESRFALVLVLVGVVGLGLVAGSPLRQLWTSSRWWIVSAVALTGVILILATIGLAHPAPRGNVTTAICAEA